MSCVRILRHCAIWYIIPIHHPGHLGIKIGADQTCCFHIRLSHYYCLEAGSLHMDGRRGTWINWQETKNNNHEETAKTFLYVKTIMKLYFKFSPNQFLDGHAATVGNWGWESPLTWAETDVLPHIFVQRLVRYFTSEDLPCFPLCVRDFKFTGYCHISICIHADVILWCRSWLRLRRPFNLRVEAPARAYESLWSWLFTGGQKKFHWWVR